MNVIPSSAQEVTVLLPEDIETYKHLLETNRQFEKLVDDGIYTSFKHGIIPEVVGELTDYIFKTLVFQIGPTKVVKLYCKSFIKQTDDVIIIEGIIQHPDGSTNRVHIKQSLHSSDHSELDAKAYLDMYEHEMVRSRDSGGREMIAKPFMILKFDNDEFYTFVTNALDGTLVDLIINASTPEHAAVIFFRALLELASYYKYLDANMLPKFVNDDLMANDVLYRTDASTVLGYTFYLHNFEYITQSNRERPNSYETVIDLLYMLITLPIYTRRSNHFQFIHNIVREICPYIDWSSMPQFSTFSMSIADFIPAFAPTTDNTYEGVKVVFKPHDMVSRIKSGFIANAENLQIPSLDMLMQNIQDYFKRFTIFASRPYESLRAHFTSLTDVPVLSIITAFSYDDFISRRLTTQLPSQYYTKYLKYVQKYNMLQETN